jgi:hypothetical protein
MTYPSRLIQNYDRFRLKALKADEIATSANCPFLPDQLAGISGHTTEMQLLLIGELIPKIGEVRYTQLQ